MITTFKYKESKIFNKWIYVMGCRPKSRNSKSRQAKILKLKIPKSKIPTGSKSRQGQNPDKSKSRQGQNPDKSKSRQVKIPTYHWRQNFNILVWRNQFYICLFIISSHPLFPLLFPLLKLCKLLTIHEAFKYF